MTELDLILHPPCEPYRSDWLPVSAQHSMYFELCGNPLGQPVVVLHGGPGSGCNPGQRRFFDPAHYNIILLDQRGCNRSLPLGCIEENTTQHLVADLESLRQHLGISRWLVFGGSWGSTLALAYAATHPEVVTGLLLRGIFLCRQHELDWFLYQSRQFFPEAWQLLVAPVPAALRDDLLPWYHTQVFHGTEAEAFEAACTWSNYEASIMSLLPGNMPPSRPDPALAIGRARVQLHYLINQGFLAERPLLNAVESFRSIPATIIQGRYDMVCPPSTAYELHQAWPEADFNIIPDAGHSAMEPGIAAALVAAATSFKQIS